MEREIVIPIPDTEDYRVVCQFGMHYLIRLHWWGHLQKRVLVKKYGFFGPKIHLWKEIDRCWWSKSIETRSELETCAFNLYKEHVLIPKKLIETAKNI